MSCLIWFQTVSHSGGIAEIFFRKDSFEKKKSDDDRSIQNYLSHKKLTLKVLQKLILKCHLLKSAVIGANTEDPDHTAPTGSWSTYIVCQKSFQDITTEDKSRRLVAIGPLRVKYFLIG